MPYTIEPPQTASKYSIEPPATPSAYSIEPPTDSAPQASEDPVFAAVRSRVTGDRGVKDRGEILPLGRDEKTGKLEIVIPETVRSLVRGGIDLLEGAEGKGPGAVQPGQKSLSSDALGVLATGAMGRPKPGAPDMVPALKKPTGEIVAGKVGGTHADIPGIKPEDQHGFVGPDGKFMNRQEAGATAQSAGLEVPKNLHSEDLNAARADRVATEGPLSRPPEVTDPRKLENQLFQLRGMTTADRVEGLHRTEALPADATPETWEKLYHHEEDPKGVPLTPEEQAIYDQHIAPMKAEADQLTRELENITGVKANVTEGNYTPRYVKGRTRSFGEALEQWKQGVEARFGGAGTRSMRKSVDAQKRRQFFNAVNSQTGEKQVVYVAPGGKVLPFGEAAGGHEFDLGELGTIKGHVAPGAKFLDGSGRSWSIEDATTKEIEGVAATRYSKNLFANRLDNLLKLRSAVRNAKFLEQLKASPDWGTVAVKREGSAVTPETNGRPWRTPKMDQFREWQVDPRIADAIDDFAKDMGDPDSLNNSLQKIGKVMNFVMFINPKAHIDNVLNHMMVERGLVGNVAGAPRSIRNLIRATKSVLTADKDYVRTLRSGASLPYARYLSDDLHAAIIKKLGGEAERDPSAWSRIAEAAGYPDAKTMLARWANVPQKVLWAASDIMTQSRTYELMERGKSLEHAFQETERHMPNYRVPGQVLGKRWLSELFGNPAVGRFGRYQYGRLASYFRMMREAFGPDMSLKERAESLDKMAMLGAYMLVLYPAMDKAWQLVTGNPNAKTTRSGAASIPQAITDVVNGDKKPGDLPASIFTPGVPLEMPMELYYGRYLWSGEPIVRQEDIEAGRYGRAAKDVLNYGAGKLSTLGQAGQTLIGKGDMGTIGLSALGVKVPTDEQATAKQRAKIINEKKARSRDRRLTAKGQ